MTVSTILRQAGRQRLASTLWLLLALFSGVTAQSSDDATGSSGAAEQPELKSTSGTEDPYTVLSTFGSGYNYILTRTFRKEMTTTSGVDLNAASLNGDIMEQVQYIDGLGRPSQSIDVKGTPLKRDLVAPIAYDGLGREKFKYLPYSYAGDGNFRPSALSEQSTFYNTALSGLDKTDSRPYSETSYENSPLNRVLFQQGPGNDWNTASKKTGYEYGTNATGYVMLWKIDGSGNCVKNSLYANGQLYRTTIIDENGSRTSEYKDKEGRVVMKESEVTTGVYAKTYYVYDDLGMLRYVLPPEMQNQVAGGATAVTLTPATASVLNYCYYYKYDARHRMTEKKLPGAEKVYMVYDKRDRLIVTQEGNLRKNTAGTDLKKWLYTKYDALNRPVVTGIYTHATVVDQAGMNIYVQGLTTVTLCESRTATNYTTQYGYTTTAFPAASPEMQSITYYDDYNFDNDASNQADKTFTDDGQTAAGSGSRKGLVTGTRSRIIDSSPASFTEGYSFYDDKGRVVQSLLIQPVDATNTGTVRMSSKINLPGEVLQAKTTHLIGATTVNTLLDKFSLDTRGRLLEVRKTVNTETEKVIAGNAYNELGQLLTESLGIAGTLVLQKTDYLYNIRGWLRALNNTFSSTENDLYGMQLFYYQAFTALNSGKEQYNGNISGIKWTNKQKSGVWAAYGFVYDKGNRLNDAIYGEYTQAATDINSGYRGAEYKDRFNEYGITYDLQGNIKTLNRRGLDLDAVTGDYSVIDQLSYTTYTGNKLIRLDDAMPDIAGRGDFREKVNNATEYYYDPNGNLYKDDNKGITNIAYNFLNLPAQVNFTASNDYIRYTYNASGAKLKKTVFKGAVAQYTENYIGGYVYKTTGAAAFSINDLQYVLAEKGRLMKSGTTFKYEYYLKDHLGNTRVVFSDVNGNGTIENNTTEILQVADYYPFGMLHNRASTLTDDNKLLYNGKELQTEAFNLDATAGEETVFDWYDYGARFYDAQIGRWHSVDPSADKYFSWSPYVYTFNDPIKHIDPDGRDGVIVTFPDYKIQTPVGKVGGLGHAGVLQLITKQVIPNIMNTAGMMKLKKESLGLLPYRMLKSVKMVNLPWNP